MKTEIRRVFATCGALFLCGPAFAGGKVVGNGGNSVVCRNANGSVSSIELLDYYEARTLRGIQFSLGASSIPVDQKVETAISRLVHVSPARAARYKSQAGSFNSEARFLPGIKLEPVSDSFHIFLPANCAVEQVVVQNEPRFPGDPRYVVNKDLWDLLDNDSKAGLMLHEIIYREAISYGHTNSIAARYFNSVITADQLKSFSLRDFINFLKTIQFPRTDLAGLDVTLWDCSYVDGQQPDCTIQRNDQSYQLKLDYYPSGNIKSYSLTYGPFCIGWFQSGFQLGNNDISWKLDFSQCGGRGELYDSADQVVKSFSGQALTLKSNGTQVCSGHSVSFRMDGSVEKCNP